MPSGQKHSVLAKRAEFIPEVTQNNSVNSPVTGPPPTTSFYLEGIRDRVEIGLQRPTVRTMRREVCCVWSLPSRHCKVGFLITRPRRLYCAGKATVHTDTLTEWDSADISLVISHPRSYLGWSELKLTGLSGWIIPGDWMTGKSKLMNLWQRPRYWNDQALSGKKKD